MITTSGRYSVDMHPVRTVGCGAWLCSSASLQHLPPDNVIPAMDCLDFPIPRFGSIPHQSKAVSTSFNLPNPWGGRRHRTGVHPQTRVVPRADAFLQQIHSPVPPDAPPRQRPNLRRLWYSPAPLSLKRGSISSIPYTLAGASDHAFCDALQPVPLLWMEGGHPSCL